MIKILLDRCCPSSAWSSIEEIEVSIFLLCRSHLWRWPIEVCKLLSLLRHHYLLLLYLYALMIPFAPYIFYVDFSGIGALNLPVPFKIFPFLLTFSCSSCDYILVLYLLRRLLLIDDY